MKRICDTVNHIHHTLPSGHLTIWSTQ